MTDHFVSHPDDLAAYDDAGVACDRLGRGDEAISWMEKKRRTGWVDARGPRSRSSSIDTTRTWTFIVHRWVRQGAHRTKIGEVKAARDEIARALEINPNAHFGGEKYQLRALEWIVDPPKTEGWQDLPNLLGWSFDDIYGQQTDPKDAHDAVRGLAGRAARECLGERRCLPCPERRPSARLGGLREGPRRRPNTLAYLAWLRCGELIDAGKGSMLPDAPRARP